MKNKLSKLVLGILCLSILCSLPVFATEATGDVIEEYIDPVEITEGVYEYHDSEGNFSATTGDAPEQNKFTDGSKGDSVISRLTSLLLELQNNLSQYQEKNIPGNVIEEYINPVEVAEGVYEYRDSEGKFLAVMYDDPSKMPQISSSNAKTTYDIDLDVEAGSWSYDDNLIKHSGEYHIAFKIDFARELPAYFGRYFVTSTGQGRVSWLNHVYSNGIYVSFNETSSPYHVAIKNMGNKSNIYTGTATVD